MGIKLRPKDWEKKTLWEIVEYNKRTWLKSWDWKKEGKYPFLNSSQKITLYYDEAFYEDKEYLVIWTGWQELILHYMNQPFSASNDNFILTIKKEDTLTKYVYYALLWQKSYIDTLYIWWGGIKHINQERLNSVEILLPPLEAQKQIVSYLDKQFEKIQSMEENLEKYKQEVEKLEESILEEVFWEMKERYEEKSIGEVAEWINWYAFKSKDFNTEWKWLQVIRIWNVLNLEKNPVYIQENNKFDRFKLKKNDIVLSLTWTIKKRDYLYPAIIEKDNSFYLNQRVGRLRCFADKINTKYLFFYIKSNFFRDVIFKYETWGVWNQWNMSLTHVLKHNLPLPPI